MSNNSSSDAASRSKRPSKSAFKQQRLPAWQPILTPKPVIIAFMVVGIIFVPIGIATLFASNSVVEIDVQYDNIAACNVGLVCNLTLNVSRKMSHPVFLYYRLENFHQNHREYVKSRSDKQLQGIPQLTYSSLSDCDPYIAQGSTSDPKNFYYPCGLIAKSVFNDTFSLSRSSGEPIPLRKKGIAWASDVRLKFHNPPPNTPGIRTIPDLEDEDFIVWMRTAGLPDFKKLNRIIDEDLEPGSYTVTVRSNFPVSSFNGKKHVVLSTASWIGGKNVFLGYAYIIVGCLCIALGFIFLIKNCVSPRKLGDTKYLEWNK